MLGLLYLWFYGIDKQTHCRQGSGVIVAYYSDCVNYFECKQISCTGQSLKVRGKLHFTLVYLKNQNFFAPNNIKTILFSLQV